VRSPAPKALVAGEVVHPQLDDAGVGVVGGFVGPASLVGVEAQPPSRLQSGSKY